MNYSARLVVQVCNQKCSARWMFMELSDFKGPSLCNLLRYPRVEVLRLVLLPGERLNRPIDSQYIETITRSEYNSLFLSRVVKNNSSLTSLSEFILMLDLGLSFKIYTFPCDQLGVAAERMSLTTPYFLPQSRWPATNLRFP